MASNDRTQSDVPDPTANVGDSVSTTPGPAQETQQQLPDPVSSLESSKPPKDLPPPDNTPEENGVPEAPGTNPDGNDDKAVPAPAQQSNLETAPSATTSPEDLGEQKVAELSPKQSDSSLNESEDSGPSLTITLLLITGSRHPFKIDAKYLRKRAVNVENCDPFAMSVYTLKELIWREWRQDWEPRPSSPSSIRLISFGKLLDDKAPLSDSKFSRGAPNVVHMTVKPQEIVDEEDAKGTKAQYTRDREASERSPRCRCVIQ